MKGSEVYRLVRDSEEPERKINALSAGDLARLMDHCEEGQEEEKVPPLLGAPARMVICSLARREAAERWRAGVNARNSLGEHEHPE